MALSQLHFYHLLLIHSQDLKAGLLYISEARKSQLHVSVHVLFPFLAGIKMIRHLCLSVNRCVPSRLRRRWYMLLSDAYPADATRLFPRLLQIELVYLVPLGAFWRRINLRCPITPNRGHAGCISIG